MGVTITKNISFELISKSKIRLCDKDTNVCVLLLDKKENAFAFAYFLKQIEDAGKEKESPLEFGKETTD